MDTVEAPFQEAAVAFVEWAVAVAGTDVVVGGPYAAADSCASVAVEVETPDHRMVEADWEVPSWVVQWAADEMAVDLDASVLQDAYADWGAAFVAFAYDVADIVEAAVAEAVESCCLPFSDLAEEEEVAEDLFPASYDSLALALEEAEEEAHVRDVYVVVLPFLSLVLLCHQNFPCPRSPLVLCPSCEEEDEVLDSSPPVRNDPFPFPEDLPSVPSALFLSPQNHHAWEDRILFQARLSPVQSLALPSASAVHALRVLPLAVLALPSVHLVHDSSIKICIAIFV